MDGGGASENPRGLTLICFISQFSLAPHFLSCPWIKLICSERFKCTPWV